MVATHIHLHVRAICQLLGNLGKALEIALRHKMFAYDAYYLAAAKRHRVALISQGRMMLEVADADGVKIKMFK